MICQWHHPLRQNSQQVKEKEERMIWLLLVNFHYRGTKDFTINLSNDGRRWIHGLTGTLKDVKGQGCSVSVEEFYLPKKREERYVRVVLNSYYRKGAGLQWIHFTSKKEIAGDCKHINML